MPSKVIGGEFLTNTARTYRPCPRWVTQFPKAEAYSAGETIGVWPIRVISSRSPFTFSRSTQKPFSALWKVTRSTNTGDAVESSDGGVRHGGPRSGYRTRRFAGVSGVSLSVLHV